MNRTLPLSIIDEARKYTQPSPTKTPWSAREFAQALRWLDLNTDGWSDHDLYVKLLEFRLIDSEK